MVNSPKIQNSQKIQSFDFGGIRVQLTFISESKILKNETFLGNFKTQWRFFMSILNRKKNHLKYLVRISLTDVESSRILFDRVEIINTEMMVMKLSLDYLIR